MTSACNLPQAKSCAWIDTLSDIIPLKVFKAPGETTYKQDNIKIGFLEDKFTLLIMKTMNSNVNIFMARNRINLNGKDDGYVLRFYITVTGFDEKPQVSIMEHGDETTKPVSVFKLSKNILDKINTFHNIIDLFIVVQMLEIKCIPEVNDSKRIFDRFISLLRPRLSRTKLEDLCFILKCSALEDVLTGRIPKYYTDKMAYIIAYMAKNSDKVAEYLKARYRGEYSKYPNADLRSILKYVHMEDSNGEPLPLEETCVRYRAAHSVGFDWMKTILSDYLLSFLHKDSGIVLNILELAIGVHDEDLFNKAVFYFLNNFHKITRSEKFELYSYRFPTMARLIMHSVRIWAANNDVYIPDWKMSDQRGAA